MTIAAICEYIWIDGQIPVGKLRSKTRLLTDLKPSKAIKPEDFPDWGFDGSSTEQATGGSSDCVLKPVRVVRDTIRGKGCYLVLCEVFNADGEPGAGNWRCEARKIYEKCEDQQPLFGLEQEYTLFDGHAPLGWPQGGYAPSQGPFYCGVGRDEEFGAEVAEEHMFKCITAGLMWCGKNGEVMCGQHEFQIGAGDPLRVADDLWLARYMLYKIAALHNCSAKLDPKPHPDMNGAGMHTNFSTSSMREDYGRCMEACHKLGADVVDVCNLKDGGTPRERKRYSTNKFPEGYGTKFELRLTGDHETCSYKQFKYGVSDRTASIRIPLHVKEAGKGYIEDRRPCADADPYRVVSYIMETVCE